MRIHATVVWGTRDGIDPFATGRKVAGELHARFVTIPGAGHLGLLTDPAIVARAINAS
jgi:pimeloyl-ACP methyl ester carboxylesterase